MNKRGRGRLYIYKHTYIIILYYSVANGQCTRTSIDYTMQEVTEQRKSITFTYSIKWKEVGE